MKYLIASDIHGSAYFTEKVIANANKLNVDKIILLGDIYNHGPRNPFPIELDEMKVASLLNGIKDKLIVIKGNCDSQVDTLISEFDFLENLVLVSGNKSVFLSHGHIFNKDCPPKTKFDAVIYGHFHVGFIEKIGDTTFANPGSTSLPKDDRNSFMVLENEVLSLYDMDCNLIESKNI